MGEMGKPNKRLVFIFWSIKYLHFGLFGLASAHINKMGYDCIHGLLYFVIGSWDF